ncbi:MAG: hypothetical protein ACXWUG_09795 [Polyangiales bacterium]
MSQVRTQPDRKEQKAAPRGVIRLLRSGLLSEERARRVLEVHGEAVESYLRVSRPPVES